MMNAASILQNLFQNSNIQMGRPLVFRNGQIFFGTVQRLFPEQHAEIQIGASRMIAKLEVPLKSGEGYWLQAIGGEGETKLKLVGPQGRSGNDSREIQLLRQLSLPSDKSHVLLARMIMQQQLPMSKDDISNAAGWLKTAGSTPAAQDAIKLMARLNLPFTEAIFHSILETGNDKPVTELARELAAFLKERPQSAAGYRLYQMLTGLEANYNKEAASKVIRELQQLALGSRQHPVSKTAEALLSKLEIRPDADDAKLVMQAAERLMKMEGQAVGDKGKMGGGLLTESENELFRRLAHRAEIQFGRQEAHQLLKQSISRTGLFYEGELARGGQPSPDLRDSLKPLLVQFVQEHAETAHKARETAEQLLFRLNGQQLLSQDHGPIQHIMYEMPLPLGKEPVSLTMQWMGRQRDNGSIDPDHCRVLFYLNLESLKETIVDVHIQNRVLTVNVINGSMDLRNLAEPLIADLKHGLKEMDYILSAVHFRMPDKQEKGRQPAFGDIGRDSYTGVDFRI
ncbi:MAG TPA: hypothetical protein VIG80_13520 [Bacillaceae bacterium]